MDNNNQTPNNNISLNPDNMAPQNSTPLTQTGNSTQPVVDITPKEDFAAASMAPSMPTALGQTVADSSVPPMPITESISTPDPLSMPQTTTPVTQPDPLTTPAQPSPTTPPAVTPPTPDPLSMPQTTPVTQPDPFTTPAQPSPTTPPQNPLSENPDQVQTIG